MAKFNDFTTRHRIEHRARRLMHVGAVVEFTRAQIRRKLGHGMLNLRGRELRHTELLEPWRVDDLAGLLINT